MLTKVTLIMKKRKNPFQKMKKYTEESFQKAVDDIKIRGKTMRTAAKDNNVPFSTLQRHISGASSSRVRGRRPALPRESEKLLAEALELMASAGRPCTRDEVIEIAGTINEENNNNLFKRRNPTRHWWRQFKKRNQLSFKTPRKNSLERKRILELFESQKYSTGETQTLFIELDPVETDVNDSNDNNDEKSINVLVMPPD